MFDQYPALTICHNARWSNRSDGFLMYQMLGYMRVPRPLHSGIAIGKWKNPSQNHIHGIERASLFLTQ
jgi:hypothetical protein